MELSSLTNNGESLAAEVLFARADNVAMLAQLLAPLVLPKGSTIATVQVAASGLTVHVGQSKVSCQARLFCSADTPQMCMATARLDAGLFQEYRVQEGPALSFGVELGTLVGTLQIFGPLQSTSAMLAWKGYGADFKCMLHEGAMVTECALRTLEVDEIDDGTAMFHGAAVAARLTLASEGLREAFAELDWESAYVQLRFAPGGFALSTAGVGASCAVEWPKDSPLLEAYECGATACHTYRLTLLAPCVKALAASAKTQLQMNAEGVLLIQHLVKGLHSTTSVVDFVFVPSAPSDGPEDDEGPQPMEHED